MMLREILLNIVFGFFGVVCL